MRKGYLNRDFLPDDIAIRIYTRKYRFYKNISKRQKIHV